jgi:alpha-D-xyloside xylohydrolase
MAFFSLRPNSNTAPESQKTTLSSVVSCLLQAPQELYRWPSVTSAARASLGLRYRLLPYLYTLTFQAHQTGAPIARPLFMEFPEDPRARATDEQFLLGPGLLVSPVLSPGVTVVEAYFPRGTWYSLVDAPWVVSGKGQTEVLPAPWDSPTPVHIRGGHIVPMQQRGLTTAAARRTPFSIVVALPDASVLGDANTEESCSKLAGETMLLGEGGLLETGTLGGVQPKFVCAAGELFLDSGDDLEMKVAAPSSTYVSFQAKAARDTDSGRVSSSIACGEFAQKEGHVLDEIVVLGFNSRPKILLLNGDPVGKDSSVSFTADQKKLVVSHLHLPLYQPFHLRWAASAVISVNDSFRATV